MMIKRTIKLIMLIGLVLTFSLPAQAYIVTFYPDTNPESTSVDGPVGFDSYPGRGSWATLHDAATGHHASPSVSEGRLILYYADGPTTWYKFHRAIFLFDTSALPDDALITAVTFSQYGYEKSDGLGIAPSVNVYSSNPISNTDITTSDYTYTRFGTDAYCDTPITYSAYNTAGYNDYVFNSTGIAAINKTGITKLAVRDAKYDVPNIAPAGGYQYSYLGTYYAEKGDGYKPMLEVTYTLPEVIPEPTSLLLLGVGVLGITLFRRKKTFK